MGLFDMFKGEFIDVIEWTDSTQDTMLWKFPRYDNAIKNGAKLTVRESQLAVFLHQGEFGDVFKPGLHTLTTNNIPVLTTLKSWKYALNSPFKADVIYANTKNFTNLGWGTQSAVTLNDARYGMYEVKARGTYAMRITDPVLFIKEIAGPDSNFSKDEVSGQLRSLIVSKFVDALAESGITADKVASNFDELGKFGLQKLQEEFKGYGLEITKFVVENVEMPEEIKKEIFSYSRLTSGIDIGKLAQFKAAQAIEKAAENPGGIAGAGAGI
jgi:membrane protease subunit (stomatin/prohibitin family)